MGKKIELKIPLKLLALTKVYRRDSNSMRQAITYAGLGIMAALVLYWQMGGKGNSNVASLLFLAVCFILAAPLKKLRTRNL